jgi:predicted Zn finger-like uncharacterized protein
MQTLCPQCSQKIVIDDAKVPDRPFNVRCPKCQSVVKLPGKSAPAPAPPVEAAPAPPLTSAAPPPPPPTEGEDTRAHMMAQIRREIALSESRPGEMRALVALPDRALAAAITVVLTRQGYQVDTLDDWEEGARLIEQGVFNLVATSRIASAAGKGETLYQRINRLNPEGRRGLFVILLGEEFKTGDGTQAWATLADLVVHSRDAASADGVLRSTLGERSRLFHVFLDARRRHEAAST